jgi:hypothetical protein
VTATLQRPLPLRIASNVKLVGMDTARSVLGQDAETIAALVDSGELPFAFDLAVNPKCERRELRFWHGAFASQPSALNSQQVLDDICPASRERWRAAELEDRWVVSNQHVLRLILAKELRGEKTGHTWWVWGASARGFLQRRKL